MKAASNPSMKSFMLLGVFLTSMNLWAYPSIPDGTPDIIRKDQMVQRVVLNGRVVGLEEEILQQSVSLQMYSSKRRQWTGWCSGTVIAKDTVLTAAHCFESDVDIVRLRFGYDGQRDSALKVVDTDDIVRLRAFENPLKQSSRAVVSLNNYCNQNGTISSLYDGLKKLFVSDYKKEGYAYRGDLALVFFKGPLPSGVKIAEWYSGELPQFKQELHSYGYGQDYLKRNGTDNRLREGVSSLYGYVGEKLPSNEVSYTGMVSFSGDGFVGMTGHGDSGGGVYVKDPHTGRLKLIGLNSGGISNPRCGMMAQVTALISPYSIWIGAAIGSHRTQVYF